MGKTEGYDEAADIEAAIKGDFAARLRVEVLVPFKTAIEEKIAEIVKKYGNASAEASHEPVNKAMDDCMETIASMIVIQYRACGMPDKLLLDIVMPMNSLILHREVQKLILQTTEEYTRRQDAARKAREHKK